MNLQAAMNDELMVVGGPADIKIQDKQYRALNTNNQINLALIDEQNKKFNTLT